MFTALFAALAFALALLLFLALLFMSVRNLRFKRVLRIDEIQRHLRLFRVMWERGQPGMFHGSGYSVKLAFGLWPRLLSFEHDRGSSSYLFTVPGLRIHYCRSYGGIFASLLIAAVTTLFILPATLAFAQAVAPVIVASTPATTEAVQNSAWWASTANEVITWLAGVAIVAFGSLSVPVFNYIRSKSTLAAMFVTQAMIDRMVAGIQNIIRASAVDLEHKIGTAPATAAGNAILSQDQKKQIAAAAQPKVEAAFKETLQRIGKTPGSQAINDMILGHVDAALAPPAPPVIPGVMARS